jgi:SAM-dependent methyltransferase
VKKKRPEELYENASDYFKGETLSWYARSKNIMRIQEKITIRAIEILELKQERSLILDAGCGPGFTSAYLKEIGHEVIALDIISEFLSFYNIKELNPIASDMSVTPFRRESFDAVISISALQWIYRDINNNRMKRTLINLAQSLFYILKPKASAIFQFYPKNNEIMEEIGKMIAENTKFKGTFIVDNPNNPKKRRIFLLLLKKK